MTRYYALVLVPGAAGTPEEEACEAAAELLYPSMRSEDDPEADHKFDWFLQSNDIGEPDDDIQWIWHAGDIVERCPELQVEAILTPDGRWHGSEAEVWDDEAWVARSSGDIRSVSRYGTCSTFEALRVWITLRWNATVVGLHLTSSPDSLIIRDMRRPRSGRDPL